MALVTPVPTEPAAEVGPVHFIAIGGAGMSAIAAAYNELGVRVSGSDQADSANLRHLVDAGVDAHVGHDPAQLGDAETVVISSAVRESNVELAEARRRGLRVWHRSAALAGLMVGRRGVAISGTHGKTTTTGMCATMLIGAGGDPSYVIGSPLSTTGKSSHLGDGDAFVIEADESDGSFLQYPAEIVVITNVESDHLDNWGTPEAYHEGFVQLGSAGTVRVAITNADDEGARWVAERLRAAGKRVVTYGEAADADVRFSDCSFDGAGSTAQLDAPGDSGPLRLKVPGRFNVSNAAAAYAVGRELGADGPALRRAAEAFGGTDRRFQFVGEAAGVRIYDDYAHHPTELHATLTAARPRAAQGRLVACFQPHLFSRTAQFADEFGAALAGADEVMVLGIYAAREDPMPGVTGELVADAARAHGASVHYVEDVHDAAPALADLVRVGDLVLTLGAGDVTTVGPALLELLRAAEAGSA
ncbi:UDP-N-acetylmuramate--L-alanine ligase [Nigerium massiliense]|uniref:UDP-N-acetylmuramate--L-alanine ligase n=1 Tax=Nigerium massiliense TaxID=1522317 RepID=UPI00058CDFDE|nr:UDP-N-acetylmuramate--L-alanine ligase [Nigerium massiliense]